LEQQREAGKLNCKEFKVFDLKDWRESARGFYSGGSITAEYYNPFQYYVLGRLTTMYSDWQDRRRNRKFMSRR
jgi:hypothetical protein